MAVRILLRRDTASNWVLNNPILLSGEIGIESDTNKFKIGNGSRWNSIASYAFKPGEANGIATLDSSGKIPTSQLPNQTSVSGEVAAAIAALTTTSLAEGTNKYFTDARAIAANASIVSGISTTAAADATTKANAAQAAAIAAAATDATTKANTAQATAISNAEGKIATAKSEAISTASNDATTKVNQALTDTTSAINTAVSTAITQEVGDRNTAISTAIGNEVINRNIAIQAEIMDLTTSDVAEGSRLYFTAQRAKDAVAPDITAAIAAIPVGSGGSIITSTTNLPEGTNLYFTNPRAIAALTPTINSRVASLQDADDQLRTFLMDMIADTNQDVTNIGNSLDNYVLESLRNQPNGYAGLNASSKILESVIPDTIATKTYTDNAIASLVGNAPEALNTIAELSAALGNDDSAIDALTTLIGTKLAIHTAASTYETIDNVALKAPIANPTFTGTVSGITKSMVGLGNANDTSDLDKPISTATQAALDLKGSQSDLELKAPLASPSFSGTVDFTNATVTGINTLPNQLDNSGKFLTTNGSSASWASVDLSLYATLISPVFAGTVSFANANVTFADSSIASSALTGSIPNSKIENAYVEVNGNTINLGESITLGGYANLSAPNVQNKIAYGTSETPSIVSPVAGDIYIQY
jgi:hypothetical protein